MGAAEAKAEKGRQYFWFVVDRSDKVSGPFALSEVLSLIAKRELSFKSYCWRSGFAEWRPIAGVDDFRPHFQGTASEEPKYPKHAIPSEGSREAVFVKPKLKDSEKRRKVTITFSKTKIKRMSVYEWAFAVLFAMLLSYFTAQQAVSLLVEEVSRLNELARVGESQTEGIVFETPMSTFMLEPILSVERLDEVLSDVGIPMSVEGRWEPLNDGLLVEGMPSELHSGFELWKASNFGLDSVYRKPLRIDGHLKVSQDPPGVSIKAHYPGSPLL